MTTHSLTKKTRYSNIRKHFACIAWYRLNKSRPRLLVTQTATTASNQQLSVCTAAAAAAAAVAATVAATATRAVNMQTKRILRAPARRIRVRYVFRKCSRHTLELAESARQTHTYTDSVPTANAICWLGVVTPLVCHAFAAGERAHASTRALLIDRDVCSFASRPIKNYVCV